jgi:hypothetical protein
MGNVSKRYLPVWFLRCLIYFHGDTNIQSESGERYPINAHNQCLLLCLLIPPDVSASRCHLQGVTVSLFISYSSLSAFINEQSPQEPNTLYILGRIPQQMATPTEQWPTPTRNADSVCECGCEWVCVFVWVNVCECVWVRVSVCACVSVSVGASECVWVDLCECVCLYECVSASECVWMC